ncbi:hypothetical protein [Pseudomonas sp. ESBL2]|uniref:hypothetical protein n=1 Tax=Pseudomonas sp. ESBL2 TaxID=3077325 RepID=UPI002FCA9518
MPTENRSSNTEMVSVPPYIGLEPLVGRYYPAKCRRCGWVGSSEELTEDDAQCTRHVDDGLCLGDCDELERHDLLNIIQAMAQPAPQPHPEPIAWMVGTAIWWTKEQAERDAAATGKPMTPFGPMTGTYTPAEQHQGEPVAVLYANGTVLTKADCGDVFDICCKVETPLYTHADHGEVERLKSIERSYGLREELLEQVKGERDRMIARTLELSDQLANQDAMLRKLKETLQREYWDEYAGLDETRELIDAALSASQEPSTPAAPYPNRLCHIDYTAHPHRCGCLKGDEESQRIYDEHCRTALARQP